VNAARRAGHRVVAVGTTVMRALETVTDARGTTVPGEGWTNLVITSERRLRSVTALITGLHEPHASHLRLLERVVTAAVQYRPGDPQITASVCGPCHLERAYAEAQARVDALYATPDEWSRHAVINCLGMGFFSSDRSVREYAERIWTIRPVI